MSEVDDLAYTPTRWCVFLITLILSPLSHKQGTSSHQGDITSNCLQYFTVVLLYLKQTVMQPPFWYYIHNIGVLKDLDYCNFIASNE